MLRLQPSEIAIAPDDIRIANARRDQYRRARGKAIVQRGPERSRDEAVTSRADQRLAPYVAEHHHEDAPSTFAPRSAQIRARLRLAARSPSDLHVQHQTAGMISTLSGLVESSRGTSLSMSHLVTPSMMEPQIDGQFDFYEGRAATQFPMSLLPATIPTTFPASQLLQSRTISAPSFSDTLSRHAIHHQHADQRRSNGADASEHSQSCRTPQISERTDREHTATGQHGTQSAPFAAQTGVLETRITEGGASSQAINNISAQDNISISRRSSSASSSAAEAAAADLPSPLDSITQQAAVAHSRLASQARQNGAHRLSPTASYQYPVQTLTAPESTQMQMNTQFSSRHRFDRGHEQWHMSSSTVEPAEARRLQSALPLGHEQSRIMHASLPTRPRHIARRPVPSRSEPNSAVEAPTRLAVPPRHSSRLHTPIAPDDASIMLQRIRPASSVSPPRSHGHAQPHLSSPTHAMASPRRNGAELQRATALPVPVHITTPSLQPTADAIHHTPRSVARARQRNQENSEEVNMSQFRGDVETLREREANQRDVPNAHGVLDDTPPRSQRLERYIGGA